MYREVTQGHQGPPLNPHSTQSYHQPSTRSRGPVSVKTLAAHLSISDSVWLRAGFYSYFIFLFLSFFFS